MCGAARLPPFDKRGAADTLFSNNSFSEVVMKPFALFTVLLLFVASPLSAETVTISSKLRVHFEVPPGWVSNPDPPQFLVDEMAEHIEHDAAQKGRHPSRDQLQKAARARFASNEALLFNPHSHAFMSLDFSPLSQGERAPSDKTIKLSARYAGESLGQEEGVTELTTQPSQVAVAGAWYAQRFDSRYKHHDKPMAFTGIVGFVSPYWFYFYYTDYLENRQDRESAEKILQSIRIEKR
jgi:hypothetical protein